MKGNSSARAREKASERRHGGRQNRDEEREREGGFMHMHYKKRLPHPFPTSPSLFPLPSFAMSLPSPFSAGKPPAGRVT